MGYAPSCVFHHLSSFLRTNAHPQRYLFAQLSNKEPPADISALLLLLRKIRDATGEEHDEYQQIPFPDDDPVRPLSVPFFLVLVYLISLCRTASSRIPSLFRSSQRLLMPR